MYATKYYESHRFFDKRFNCYRPIYTQIISGPKGTVQASNMAFCTDDPERLEETYWTIVHTLEGAYHCCFTGFSNWL